MTIRIQGHKLEYTDKAYRTMGYKCCPDCGNWFKPPEKFKARILCVKCQSTGATITPALDMPERT